MEKTIKVKNNKRKSDNHNFYKSYHIFQDNLIMRIKLGKKDYGQCII